MQDYKALGTFGSQDLEVLMDASCCPQHASMLTSAHSCGSMAARPAKGSSTLAAPRFPRTRPAGRRRPGKPCRELTITSAPHWPCDPRARVMRRLASLD
eukprot:3262665-Amphidinium_carterae.1